MSRVSSAIGWRLNRVFQSFGNLLSYIVRCFVKVKPGRVLCWAYTYKQYGCNPRYLTEYLLEHHPEMEILWVFRRGVDISCVDSRIKCVRSQYQRNAQYAPVLKFIAIQKWHSYKALR